MPAVDLADYLVEHYIEDNSLFLPARWAQTIEL